MVHAIFMTPTCSDTYLPLHPLLQLPPLPSPYGSRSLSSEYYDLYALSLLTPHHVSFFFGTGVLWV
jgi:hypothetical protein